MNKDQWEKLEMQMLRSLKLMENDRQWIVKHYFDSRANPVEMKIRFDNETRTSIMYLKSVIEDLNLLRSDVGIDPI